MLRYKVLNASLVDNVAFTMSLEGFIFHKSYNEFLHLSFSFPFDITWFLCQNVHFQHKMMYYTH